MYAPFGCIVQPIPMRSSPSVCTIHSPEHQLLNPSAVVHYTYVSEQSQFPAYQFLRDVLFQVLNSDGKALVKITCFSRISGCTSQTVILLLLFFYPRYM